MKVLAAHSSGDYYGSDRVFLECLRAFRRTPSVTEIKVLLPEDWRVDERFTHDLRQAGAEVFVEKLPILRRALLHPKALLNLLWRSISFMQVLFRERPDVLYLGSSACLLLAPLGRIAGVSNVILHNQELWRGPERWALGCLGQSVARSFCISNAVMQSMPRKLQKRSHVVLNGATGSPQAREAVRPRLKRENPRLLVASRWNRWKGHKTLLEAWQAAGLSGELWILGSPPAFGDSVDVRKMVDDSARKDSIRLIGEVPSIKPYLDDIDVLVVPSDLPEPFGLVALEAFERGVPVIASDSGGITEVVDSETGWLFPRGDAAELSRVIASLDWPAIDSRSERARKRFQRHFSNRAFGERLNTAISLALSDPN